MKNVNLAGEQAKALIGDLVAGLMATREKGEWMSISVNVTSDPEGEAPIALIALLPGTTKEHAKAIQTRFGLAVGQINEGK